MAQNHMKDVWRQQSLGKFKWKPQWDTTSCPLGWLLKTQDKTKQNKKLESTGKDMEKLEF